MDESQGEKQKKHKKRSEKEEKETRRCAGGVEREESPSRKIGMGVSETRNKRKKVREKEEGKTVSGRGGEDRGLTKKGWKWVEKGVRVGRWRKKRQRARGDVKGGGGGGGKRQQDEDRQSSLCVGERGEGMKA